MIYATIVKHDQLLSDIRPYHLLFLGTEAARHKWEGKANRGFDLKREAREFLAINNFTPISEDFFYKK